MSLIVSSDELFSVEETEELFTEELLEVLSEEVFVVVLELVSSVVVSDDKLSDVMFSDEDSGGVLSVLSEPQPTNRPKTNNIERSRIISLFIKNLLCKLLLQYYTTHFNFCQIFGLLELIVKIR